MRTWVGRSFVVAGALFALLSGMLTVAAQDTKVDVTGTWTFNVQTSAGGGTPTVTLKQDGETLSGHYSSELLGESDLTGTVKGNAIRFTLVASVQGQSFDVTYSGTVESETSLKGTVVLGPIGEGTFTGKR